MPKVLAILEKILPKEDLKKELLLALELSEEKRVKAAVWQMSSGLKPKILDKAVGQFGGDWEDAFAKIDQLVTALLEEVEREGRVKKVIFGLPSSFVEGEKIKPSHLSNLKKLCQRLKLTPSGFIETPQAITHLLKEKEDHPLTVILLRAGKSVFSFNIFKLGKEIGAKTVFYKENITAELSRALKEFSGQKTFPSKILLYDGEQDLEKVKQSLLKHPWEKEAGFFHFPQIEILDEGFSLLALITAGVAELTKETLTTLEKEQVADKEPEEEKTSSQELGFFKEEDVVKKKALVEKSEEKKEEEEMAAEEEELGEEMVEEVGEIEKEEREEGEEKRFNFVNSFLSATSAARGFFKKMSFNLGLKRLLPLLFLLIFILGGIIFYFYWLSPQAKVTLLVEPYSLEEDAEITLSLSAAAREDSLQISGNEVTVEKADSETSAVATKKEVGEPARGEVTVYNKTTNKKSFSKGTVIIGPKGLEFTLDSDVSVASLSDVVAGTPGKEKAKVTAAKIGPEGNLGGGSDFTFEDYPVTSYASRNEEAFSGGTSREVTVVGEKDQEDLLELLKNKLTEGAKEELEKKLDPSEKLLEETIEGKILRKKFNREIGDEASDLALDLAMSFQAVSYNEEELAALLKRIAGESAPSGYRFDKEAVEMEVVSIEKEGDKILFNAHFQVKLMPEIKTDELQKRLASKRLTEVEEHLRTIPNLSGFEIQFVSYLPFMRQTLPFNPQKLFIEIRPF